MNGTDTDIRRELEGLSDEVERYLSVVELFRAEGCEPAYQDDETPARLISPYRLAA